MNLGQACRPCRRSCSLIPGRDCFDDLPGDEIVVSTPSPIVEPLLCVVSTYTWHTAHNQKGTNGAARGAEVVDPEEGTH